MLAKCITVYMFKHSDSWWMPLILRSQFTPMYWSEHPLPYQSRHENFKIWMHENICCYWFFCCWKSKYKPVPWLNQIVWQPEGLGADCWPSAGMGSGEIHSLLATRALSRCFQSPMSNPSQPLEYWQTLYRCSSSFIIDIPIVPLAIVRIPECDLWYLSWAPKVKDKKPEMIIWFYYNAEHNHHNCQHTQGCRCSWLTSS